MEHILVSTMTSTERQKKHYQRIPEGSIFLPHQKNRNASVSCYNLKRFTLKGSYCDKYAYIKKDFKMHVQEEKSVQPDGGSIVSHWSAGGTLKASWVHFHPRPTYHVITWNFLHFNNINDHIIM